MLKKILTSRKGRKCKRHGCKQILSIYNHELFCHTHAEDKDSMSKLSKGRR